MPLFALIWALLVAHVSSFRWQTPWSRVGTRRPPAVAAATAPAASDYTAVMIVPTGIGASIGGYAGDALPAARVLASVVDTLVTHPNVLNGAMLYWPMPNVLYVEGYALDEFAAGRVALRPQTSGCQRVGLLLDRAMEVRARDETSLPLVETLSHAVR